MNMLSLRSCKIVIFASLIVGAPAGVVNAGSTSSPEAGKIAPLSTPAGVGPLIDAVKDLPIKADYDVNSWFVTGHFTAEGHTISCLYHVMVMSTPDGQRVIQSVASVTDETTGWYSAGDIVLPYTGAGETADGIHYKLPNGEMQITPGAIHAKATLKNGSLDLQMTPISATLYNGGTGIFPLLGMTIHEYSVPVMKTTGSITMDGKTYKIDGNGWFDRQWQDNAPAGSPEPTWSWMGLRLDNGDSLSLWSAFDDSIGKDRAWATVLHPDGSQTVAAVEPSLGAADEWTSEESGNTYPTRWSVSIPALDIQLAVVPAPRRQEIISVVPFLTKYEGASTVSGSYGGKPVQGYGYVELVGAWK
jgi:predicted secreted hydrolase